MTKSKLLPKLIAAGMRVTLRLHVSEADDAEPTLDIIVSGRARPASALPVRTGRSVGTSAQQIARLLALVSE